MSIKTAVEDFLSNRPHKTGDTIQFGWFIFRVVSPGQPPKIESLDFREMASYTQNFSEVERIHHLQMAALARFQVSESPCALWHSAIVSLSYSPGRKDAFMKRDASASKNDSGWYIGVRDEPRSMDDPGSFERRSLYELTIRDMRTAAYWLLPQGKTVYLNESA
jgi:hypothetical protein